MVDAGDDPRFAGRQPHDVAVVGPHDFADALGAGEIGVFGEMQRLAVRRHGDLRLQPIVELSDLGAARMAGNVDEMGAVGDDLDALLGQRVDDPADRLLVAGNGARGKDDAIAGCEA